MNNDNPTESNKTPAVGTVSAKDKLPRLKERKSIVLILFLVIIAGVAGYLLYKNSNKSSPSSNMADYSYDEDLGDKLTIEHLLKGSERNAGLSLKIPLNGVVYSDSPYDKADERLIPNSRQDVIIDEGNYVTMGQRIVEGVDGNARAYFQSLVAVRIVPKDEQSQFNLVDYFRRIIANHSFNTSSTVTTASFVPQMPEKYTNENIKNNASIYKFQSDLLDPNNDNPVKNLQGELIEIKTKNAHYYVLIGATESIWNSSTNTWQALKDSIKVDQ